MNQQELTVFVVDDDVSVREAMKNLLRSVGLKVATFSRADEFLASEPASAPSCLVLDVRLPGLSGLDLQRQLAEINRAIPIVFITGHGDVPMSVRAMKAGAVEFLTKPFRDQDLLDAVRHALELDRQNRTREAETTELRQRYASLTSRELQVLRFIFRGYINKQIAAETGISEPTVKMHRSRLMDKMRADSLADLIRMVQTLGIPGEY